ncbi:caspase family protein [candidate division KSB1 bacterium]|nr:caspase family protein [candidate division KSB1 bacterium]
MNKKIYALLVGIDEYQQNSANRLYGCVNDVRSMEDFLNERASGGDIALELRKLTSGDSQNRREIKPTYEMIIESFRQHLCQAGKNDVALFYYSGHGSQEYAPEVFWDLDPDRLNETIVCYDSRMPGHYDLADKELALLIEEVATRDEKGKPKDGTPHIVVIMDSCHSGSGTRETEDTGIRHEKNDTRARPLDSYIITPARLKALAGGKKSGSRLVPPQGRHILLAACRAEETAKERNIGESGERHGLFSFYLLDALKRSGHGLTYHDLHTLTTQKVKNAIASQTPQIESVEAQDQNAYFLDGAIRPRRAIYQVNWSDEHASWLLDAGAMHGIQAPIGNETTRLALFPFEEQKKRRAAPFAGRKMSDGIGYAKVQKVTAGESLVVLDSLKQTANKEQTFAAAVVSHPLPPLQVYFDGDPAMLKAVRDELAKKEVGDDIPLVVQETNDESLATLRLTAKEHQYDIRRIADAYPLTIQTDDAVSAVARLAHVARWFSIANLENKNSQLPVDAVRLEFKAVEMINGKQVERSVTGHELNLHYANDNSGKHPQFKLTLHNETDQVLYCAILDLTELFGIQTAGLNQNSCIKLAPKGMDGASVPVLYNNSPLIPAAIPKRIRQQGIDKLTDILKIIVSSDQINPALFEQDDLEMVRSRGVSRAAGEPAPPSTLGRLMRRISMRGVGDQAGVDDLLSDWMTIASRIIIHWPLDVVAVPEEGGVAPVGGEVQIAGHPALKAKVKVRLRQTDASARGAIKRNIPPVLRSAPMLIEPFEFSPSRAAEHGQNGIELLLDDAADIEKVTPESPLLFHTSQTLKKNESVLLVSYDPENDMYVPVGYGYAKNGGADIRVDQLPRPMDSGERDVKGSLLMLAFKLIPEKAAKAIGIEDPYPRLRIATCSEGAVSYDEGATTHVRDCVARAKRILLLVHGMLGDTRRMVAGIAVQQQQAPELQKYDLILTFDYENINTRIQDSAAKLKERLEEVGLAAGHGKTLDVIASDLGTLVCRWFIEREGGNEIASRLVMLGAPNSGTPMAVLQQYARNLIILGLNGLLTLINPAAMIVKAVAFIAAAIAGLEKVDTTLDQLKPKSDLIVDINSSVDPMIPYLVIAGSTGQIKDARGQDSSANAFVRLSRAFFSKKTVYKIISLEFGMQPNDAVVSVKSAETVALLKPERNPMPKVQVVDCDHFSYLTSQSAIKAVADFLHG